MWLPKPLEMGIVMGLLNNSPISPNDSNDIQEGKLIGYKTMSEIIYKNSFWKSQTTNFPKYIKPLIHNRMLIEEGLIHVNHKYRKKSKHYVWRLKRNRWTYESIINWCAIYDRLSKYDGSFSLETSNFKDVKPYIKKLGYTDYFITSDYYRNISEDIKKDIEFDFEQEKVTESLNKGKNLLKSYQENIVTMLKLEAEIVKKFKLSEELAKQGARLDIEKYRSMTINKMKKKGGK